MSSLMTEKDNVTRLTKDKEDMARLLKDKEDIIRLMAEISQQMHMWINQLHITMKPLG